ncbi:MAG TPA: haloacid dehalogenase [Limnobacter sp.]|nr:haloacid dehalogenase [Limnobacter sp.]
MHIPFLNRPKADLAHRVYLLDLDNTLHLAADHILPEINRQMTQYLVTHLQLPEQQASALRTRYWLRYGATLLGMMRHHGTNPHHFLAQTHRFDGLGKLSCRHPSVPLRLSRLPGLRILLTNAPRAYALEVCKAQGLYRHLHAIVAIEDMVIHRQWRPKPANILWPKLKRTFRHKRPMLVDDTHGHLKQAALHGYQTVWITPPGIRFGPRTTRGPVRHRIRHFEAVKAIR